MTLKEAEKLAMQVLKNVMEDKINKSNVELCAVTTSEKVFKVFGEDYVETVIKTLS
jgi:20S proteasome subunit alpha 5